MTGKSQYYIDTTSSKYKLHEHLTPDLIDQVKKLKSEDMHMRKIAKKLKISLTTVYKYARQ